MSAVAYHEAGHAVVAEALGWEVGSVEIYDAERGFTGPYYYDDEPERRELLAVYTAGQLAELKLPAGRLREISTGDLDMIEALDPTDHELGDGERLARAILRANWSSVERLVAVLLNLTEASS